MFKDELRDTVWNEIRQHDLHAFEKQLTPQAFAEAARRWSQDRLQRFEFGEFGVAGHCRGQGGRAKPVEVEPTNDRLSHQRVAVTREGSRRCPVTPGF